ncbi:MAG: hypothetical protein ACRDVF_18635 [Microbacterium sp.]|uniref:hypothetical protein n=1 Tax=Microbacterium sp. TaxID=51671 RepID=UPI003D6FDA6A
MTVRTRARVAGAYAIALIALIVALGGGAYALKGKNTVGSGDIKPNTIKLKDISPSAEGARASGLVDPDGGLINAKGVASVSHPLTGRYCITPKSAIDPDTATLVVGAVFDHDSTPAGAVVAPQWLAERVHCPSGTLEVAAFQVSVDPGGIGQQDNSFAFVIP